MMMSNSLFKGDGVVSFGPLSEGEVTPYAAPLKIWNDDLGSYLAAVKSLNPNAGITLNWIDSPTLNANGLVEGRFRLYDANLYTQEEKNIESS